MSDSLPPLRDVISRHDIGAKKSLGQHFLLDLNLTRKIAAAAAIEPQDHVIEIGPGPGGLTRAILERGAALTAIERDTRCIDALHEVAAAYPGRLDIIEADALAVNEREYGAAPFIICANLPYNISTELLIKWLRGNHADRPPLWSRMALMFQKEVADRILAAPGGKAYGRLSVISQAASRPRRAFNLPARAFTPPPKVDSAVVIFERAASSLSDIGALERVTQAAFGQRRKMLRTSLKTVFADNLEMALDAAGASPTDRAEDLRVEQFVCLASLMSR